MTGISQYKPEEIKYILKAIVKKTRLSSITEGFRQRFDRKLNPNQIRYIKNKYGKDPSFKSPMVNYRGGNAADLEDSDDSREKGRPESSLAQACEPESSSSDEQFLRYAMQAPHDLVQPDLPGPNLQAISQSQEMQHPLGPGQILLPDHGPQFHPVHQLYQQPPELLAASQQLLPAETGPRGSMVSMQANSIAQNQLGWIHLPSPHYPYYAHVPDGNNPWVQDVRHTYPMSMPSAPLFVQDNSIPVSQIPAGYHRPPEANLPGTEYTAQAAPYYLDSGMGARYSTSTAQCSKWHGTRDTQLLPLPLPARASTVSRKQNCRHNPYSRPPGGATKQKTHRASQHRPVQVEQQDVPLLLNTCVPELSQAAQRNVVSSSAPSYTPEQLAYAKTIQESVAAASLRLESSARPRQGDVVGMQYGAATTTPRWTSRRPVAVAQTAGTCNEILANLAEQAGPSRPVPASSFRTGRSNHGQQNDGRSGDPSAEVVDPMADFIQYPPSEPQEATHEPHGSSSPVVGIGDQNATALEIDEAAQAVAANSHLEMSHNLLELGESPSEFVPLKTTPLGPCSSSSFLPGALCSNALVPKLGTVEEKQDGQGGRVKGKCKEQEKGKEKETDSHHALAGGKLTTAQQQQRLYRLKAMMQAQSVLSRLERNQVVANRTAAQGQARPPSPGGSEAPFLAHGDCHAFVPSRDLFADEELMVRPALLGQDGAGDTTACMQATPELSLEALNSWENGVECVKDDGATGDYLPLGCNDALPSIEYDTDP